MSSKGYQITKSNYTLRKRHQKLSDGVVFERDFMTTTAPGSWEGDVFSYNESNFKMVTRVPSGGARQHVYGEWEGNGCTPTEENNGEYWTYVCMGDITGTTENKIVIKPNYTSFLDFAYYGSLYLRLKTTVEYIINNFPAELYVTNKITEYWDDENGVTRRLGYNAVNDLPAFLGSSVMSQYPELSKYTGSNLVTVSNPFEIDTTSLNIRDDVQNPLRYFVKSSRSYSIVKGSSTPMYAGVIDWQVLKKVNGCKNGDLTAVVLINNSFTGATGGPSSFFLLEYYVNGKYYLVTHSSYATYSMRPLDEEGKVNFLNIFFDSLDDFGRLILNRESDPKYTCTIDYPMDTDKGLVTYKRSFTWPVLYGYNLDIETIAFTSYLDGLKKLAIFYDNGWTNNLWNRMTHVSIKNMDMTYLKTDSTDTREDYELGTARMEAVIEVFARMLDDIKMNIDNVARTNRITYDENGNLPDYFLSDSLEMSGWEVSDSTNGLGKPSITRGNKTWSVSDVNVEFLRRLKLNSDPIFTRKGTKAALEMILALFNLRSYQHMKIEYEQKYNQITLDGTESSTMTPFNSLTSEQISQLYDYKIDEYVAVATPRTNFVYSVGEDEILPLERYNMLKSNYDSTGESLQGLACTVVSTGTERYVIPWFASDVQMDGKPYFQAKGGWGKVYSKTVNGHTIYDYNGHDLYDETLKYVNVVKNVGDLSKIPDTKLHGGDICYVYSIEDYEDYFGEAGNDASNYFYLENPEDSDVYGANENATGWTNVTNTEIENGADLGMRVLYMQSIIDEIKGNNPHVGYANYDEGETYLDYYRNLFKGAIDNDYFTDDAYICSNSGTSDVLLSGITESGFDIDEPIDNMKCWFFSDNASDMPYYFDGSMGLDNAVPDVGEDSNETQFESHLTPFAYESGMDTNSESASFSVINQKKIKITFDGYYTAPNSFKEYFYKSINPYLKQVIPSTTIFEVDFASDHAIRTSYPPNLAAGFTNNSEVNTYDHQ